MASLDEASSGIDLGLDDESAAPASVRQGAAAIRSHWATLPLGPGVYRMLAADGEVLYVGKAKSLQEARRELHARGRPFAPHRPDDRADRLHGVRLDRDRDRGAAARSQLHQADAAALQRR